MCFPGPDASGRLSRGEERSRDSWDTARRGSPPGGALPRGAGDRGNPERGAARSRARGPARCGSQARFEPGGRQPCAFRPQCALRSGARRPLSVSLLGVGAKVSSDESLRLARGTTSQAFKVISHLLSISTVKAFYGGFSGFSRTVSALQSASTAGVMMPFLCFEEMYLLLRPGGLSWQYWVLDNLL